jgi:hypothetical protein
MAAVPFDTLKLARRLEAAGFSGKQAADTAEALAEAMSGAELATKPDLVALRAGLKGEIAALRVELKTDIAALRAEFKADIAALRAELKADIALVRREMEVLRRDMTIRLGSKMIVAVGILLAAIRYLPPAH